MNQEPNQNKSKTQAELLIETSKQADLFLDFKSKAYASFFSRSHDECAPVRSKQFKSWLTQQFYKKFQKAPSQQAITDAIAHCEAHAISHGEQREVFLRVGGDDDRVVIDLGNNEWNSVVVDRTGWKIADRHTIHFRRSSGTRALPTPIQTDKDPRIFLEFLNVKEKDLALILGWMIMALRPAGPYPILFVHGEQGSAKSTTCRICRQLVDPNQADLRTSPRDDRDLAVVALNNHVFALENLSNIPNWLSDSLCRISTGGAIGLRGLYTNSDEEIIEFQRPILVNGIENLANRSDLLDRSILVNLPTISQKNRKTEKDLWKRFNDRKGVLFGILLNAVSSAIKNLGQTVLESPPRLADFAEWILAAEVSVPFPTSFIETYKANTSTSNEDAIEANPIGKDLVAFVKDVGRWQGIASDLLKELNDRADDGAKLHRDKNSSWPKSGRKLSGLVRRLAPNLRATGIGVTPDLPGREIRLSMQNTVNTVATVEESENPNGTNGLNGDMQDLSNPDVKECVDCGHNMHKTLLDNGVRKWLCEDCELKEDIIDSC